MSATWTNPRGSATRRYCERCAYVGTDRIFSRSRWTQINILHNHPHLAERTHAGRLSLAGFKILSQTVLECLAKGFGSGLPVPVPIPMPGRGRKKKSRVYVCMYFIRKQKIQRFSDFDYIHKILHKVTNDLGQRCEAGVNPVRPVLFCARPTAAVQQLSPVFIASASCCCGVCMASGAYPARRRFKINLCRGAGGSPPGSGKLPGPPEAGHPVRQPHRPALRASHAREPPAGQRFRPSLRGRRQRQRRGRDRGRGALKGRWQRR